MGRSLAASLGSAFLLLLALVLTGSLLSSLAPTTSIEAHQSYDPDSGRWLVTWVESPGWLDDWYYARAGYPLPLPFSGGSPSLATTARTIERDGVTYVETTTTGEDVVERPWDYQSLGWTVDYEPDWDEGESEYSFDASRGDLTFGGRVHMTPDGDVTATYSVPLGIATGEALKPFPPSPQTIQLAMLVALVLSLAGALLLARRVYGGHG